MIILEMILRITGWTQEELANELNVSRATVNAWLNGTSLSNSSKRLISDRFNFPIHFFETDLDQRIEYYKLIYSVLVRNLTEYKNKNKTSYSDKDKVLDILNRIESDDSTLSKNEDISDTDIIDGLINGYDPFTGEVFNDDHILRNKRVNELICNMKTYNKFAADNIEYEDLTSDQKRIFDDLREWRRLKMLDENLAGAYLIFNDRTLLNISCYKFKDKKDLLEIKGVGPDKYRKYGEEIYRIIKG